MACNPRRFDKCELGKCRHLSYDMEGVYCVHPEAMAVSWAGLSPNAMTRRQLCIVATDDINSPMGQLWEPA